MVKKLYTFDTEDNSLERINNPEIPHKMTNGGIMSDDGQYTEFSNCDEFLELLPKKDNTIMFAHNAEYDIINIFSSNFSKLEMHYHASRFIFAKIKGTKVIICDSFNYVKASLKKIGDIVGLKKLPFDPDSLEYRKRDCEILFKFFGEMQNGLVKMGLDLGYTQPATAMKIFQKKFIPTKNLVHDFTDKDKEFMRKALFGGRVEIFRHGEVKGDVRAYDINSLYPYVMHRNKYPELKSIVRAPNISLMGVTYCTIKSDFYIPMLPYKDKNNKLLFPNGTFRGIWTNVELDYFQQCGGEILKIHDGIHFTESFRPFTRYVTHYYDEKKYAKNEIDRSRAKLNLNSIFGKFGQTGDGETIKVIGKKEPYSGLFFESENNEKLGIFKEKRIDPIYSNVIWSCYITAYARIELHKYLATYSENLLYCDTDCVFLLNREMETSDELGGMKLECAGENAYFDLPKKYIVWWNNDKTDEIEAKFSAKGYSIKKDTVNILFNDRFSAKRSPNRFRSSIRSGVTPNAWSTKVKRSNTEYNKRKVLSDGRTEPLVIK